MIETLFPVPVKMFQYVNLFIEFIFSFIYLHIKGIRFWYTYNASSSPPLWYISLKEGSLKLFQFVLNIKNVNLYQRFGSVIFFLRIRIRIRPKNQKRIRIRILVKYCMHITKNEQNIFLSPLFGKINLEECQSLTWLGVSLRYEEAVKSVLLQPVPVSCGRIRIRVWNPDPAKKRIRSDPDPQH